MQHAGNGRNGLLQEGGPSREPYGGSFNGAFVLRSQLFAEWNHWFEWDSASAPINEPNHSCLSIIYAAASRGNVLISSFKLGR